jgi:hypothetical protein
MIIRQGFKDTRVIRIRVEWDSLIGKTLNCIKHGFIRSEDQNYYSASEFMLFITTENEYFLLIGEHLPACSYLRIKNREDQFQSLRDYVSFDEEITTSRLHSVIIDNIKSHEVLLKRYTAMFEINTSNSFYGIEWEGFSDENQAVVPSFYKLGCDTGKEFYNNLSKDILVFILE